MSLNIRKGTYTHTETVSKLTKSEMKMETYFDSLDTGIKCFDVNCAMGVIAIRSELL
jgi:hypothetical protein